MVKTVVIGLDGANWPLIDPWIEAGRLPNIAALRERGAAGVSRSFLPPVTCPNWKCYASGKNPGKLGVYWWERIDTAGRSMTLPNSTDFTSPELWDYVNDAGLRAGVINLPMSYPPREIDGFMVAGGPRSREVNYTIPAAMEHDLEERFDYRVHPENVLTSNKNSAKEVAMVHRLLRTRLQTAADLAEREDVDFLHVTLFHLNVLQHYFWNGEETRRAWEIIDEELAPFVDRGYNIVLMSDHGCTEIDTVFYINTWLEEKGYLKTKQSLSSRLYDVGITQEGIASIVRKVGLEKHIRPLVPRALIERFPNSEGVVREEKLSMVDWERTTAIGSGQGLVYVVADDEYERDRILADLERDLAEVVGLDGRPIAVDIHRREDLYEGEYVARAPDLIFDQRPGVHTSEAMGGGEVMSAPTNWRGENVPEGMVLFAGEGVAHQELDPIRIADIAPTVLHWMGLAVPADMDGSPITHVFDAESEPGRREAEVRTPLPARGESTAPEDLDDDVRDRLVEIGYLE